MQIDINNLIPAPLKDRFRERTSQVWGQKLVIQKGEWLKIKAPSGSGKTTLIHFLYKLRHDFEGDILWDGKNIRAIDATTLAAYRQQHISIVFQDLRLFPHLTARENINLKRVMQQPLYDESMIDQMAERLSIAPILSQQAATCSYGEQQRIAIIRAMMQPFDLLLMDEPFSHLDTENIERAAALIREECTKRQAAFILTDLEDDTHFSYTKQVDL